MAQTYKFINNVQAMENSVTNYYAIGILNMVSEPSESLDKGLISEIMNEQITVYETVETFAKANMEEQDLDLLITNLTKEINKLTFSYIKSFNLGFSDLTTGESLLSKLFNFGKK